MYAGLVHRRKPVLCLLLAYVLVPTLAEGITAAQIPAGMYAGPAHHHKLVPVLLQACVAVRTLAEGITAGQIPAGMYAGPVYHHKLVLVLLLACVVVPPTLAERITAAQMPAGILVGLAQARGLVVPLVKFVLRLMFAEFAAVMVLHVAMRGIAPVRMHALAVLVARRTQHHLPSLASSLIFQITKALHSALVHAQMSPQ